MKNNNKIDRFISIVSMYYLHSMTLREIGKLFNLSHQRIQQIVAKGFPEHKERNSNDANKLQGRERTRFLVRQRDDFTCQTCRERRTPEESKRLKVKQFDVHHLNGLCGKKSRSYDPVSTMDTMITLCHRCHFNHPEHRFKFSNLDKVIDK